VRTDPRLALALVASLALALPMAPATALAQTGPAGITRTAQLPSDALKTWRKQMLAGRSLNDTKLRSLADALDSLAAFNFAKRLEEKGDLPSRTAAVHYYSISAYLGREIALTRLIKLLKDPEIVLTPSRQKGALDALTRASDKGNGDAAVALSQLYAAGHPFGRDPEATAYWLERAAATGNEDAALKLALAAMTPTDGSAPDPDRARRALLQLAQTDNPGRKAMAAALLARLDAMPALPPLTTGVIQ